MSKRYQRARAMGRERYEEVYNEDRDLLMQFGLGLLAVDGAIVVSFLDQVKGNKIQPWDRAEIDGRVWDRLQPLLMELIELRSSAAPLQMAAK